MRPVPAVVPTPVTMLMGRAQRWQQARLPVLLALMALMTPLFSMSADAASIPGAHRVR